MQNERRRFLKYMCSMSAFVAGSVLSLNKNSVFKKGVVGRTEPLAMGAAGKEAKGVKKIAVEEHCHTKGHLEWLRAKTDWKGPPSEEAMTMAADMGEVRLAYMDEAGIDMQVLSLSYPDIDPFNTEDAITVARIVNNELSETVKEYPDRFASFCCLPLQDPEAAADELERAVTKLGLKGAMVNETEYTPERMYSDHKYEVIYERLSKLNVPIYLHQRGSGERLIPDLINLIGGDILDKYPNLQFILGHGGEGMPFWLWRRGRSQSTGGRRSFKQKFVEHFYVTTSDQCSDTLLQFLIEALGSDRIMFATDYPYESSKRHVDWIDSAKIGENDREKICYLNAERLFKL